MTYPALIIVDMQHGMSTPAAGVRNNPQAELMIKRLLAVWRAQEAPIVHVRHMSRSPHSLFWPGQAGAAFQAAFEPLHHEHVVEKNVPDAFIHTGLERWLHMRGINSVVVVGVSTNNSVEASVRTAGNLGFNTHLIADATFAFAKTDYDGLNRTAQEVHAMSLANLQDEYAKVLTTDAILKQVFGVAV